MLAASWTLLVRRRTSHPDSARVSPCATRQCLLQRRGPLGAARASARQSAELSTYPEAGRRCSCALHMTSLRDALAVLSLSPSLCPSSCSVVHLSPFPFALSHANASVRRSPVCASRLCDSPRTATARALLGASPRSPGQSRTASCPRAPATREPLVRRVTQGLFSPRPRGHLAAAQRSRAAVHSYRCSALERPPSQLKTGGDKGTGNPPRRHFAS